MRIQHCCWQWLGVVRQQAITWANVAPDLSCHMVSVGQNELTIPKQVSIHYLINQPWLNVLLLIAIARINKLIFCWSINCIPDVYRSFEYSLHWTLCNSSPGLESTSYWSRSCLIIMKNDKLILADSKGFPQNMSFRIKNTTWCRTSSMIYSQLNWLAEDNRTIFIILYICLEVWCTRQMYLYTCLEMYILEDESCSMCLKLSDIILKTSTYF